MSKFLSHYNAKRTKSIILMNFLLESSNGGFVYTKCGALPTLQKSFDLFSPFLYNNFFSIFFFSSLQIKCACCWIVNDK